MDRQHQNSILTESSTRLSIAVFEISIVLHFLLT